MRIFPDIYFLPEWGQVFKEHDDGEVRIFEYKSNYGHIYYQFIVRNDSNLINSTKYYDIVTTYGFNGPIILECGLGNKKTLLSEFNHAFDEYCMDNNIVSEWIRFNPWLMNHLDFGSIYTTKYNNYTVFIDLTVNDFFKDEYHPSARTSIRKALKSDVKVEFDYSGQTLDDFHRLYQMNIRKNKISKYYQFDIEFLKKTFKCLKDKQLIIYAKYEDQIISSAILLSYGDYLHYHLAANDPKYYYLNSNSLIFYEACIWAKNRGKKQFHLGGAFTEDLFKFKKQFTRNGFCDFYVGKKIRNENIYKKLVEKRVNGGTIKNMLYFPLYRG